MTEKYRSKVGPKGQVVVVKKLRTRGNSVFSTFLLVKKLLLLTRVDPISICRLFRFLGIESLRKNNR